MGGRTCARPRSDMIDASIVPRPKQRNGRNENAAIKAGETAEGRAAKPAKNRQKDTDARWTKKHGKSHYGYKNHVKVDRRHKLIRRYTVTDAAVHDSQIVDDVLDDDNAASHVWADRCACRLLPNPCCFPRYSGGSASASSLSRPAQTSLALRPAGSLNRPRRPLSRGFDNYLGGAFLHWCYAPSGCTE